LVRNRFTSIDVVVVFLKKIKNNYFLLFLSGSLLATSSGDGTVKVWDFLESRCTATFTDHTQVSLTLSKYFYYQ
jgi:WD40 repeat protein